MAKSKETEQELKQAEQEHLSAKFETAAVGLAKLFAQSLDDLRGAYGSKKDNLTAVFDGASKAKSDRGSWFGWSVFWTIVLPPIAIYTAYKSIESHIDLRDLRKEVDREVNAHRAKELFAEGQVNSQDDIDAKQVERLAHSPFKTRITSGGATRSI